MRKSLFLSALAISSTLLATEPVAEVKTGYFFFSDSTMRKIYDNGGWDVQLCASYPLFNLTRRWSLNAYGAVEYLQLSGHSLNDHQKTSLWQLPVNLGLQPVYTINANTQYYFSLGPRYFYVHQHNDSSYVSKNKSKNGIGLFVNTGFKRTFCKHFVFDVFGEYSYAKVHFNSGKPEVYTNSVQVGGFTFGAGLGYGF